MFQGPEITLHIAVLDFLVIWVWKSRQSMQRPNEQQQRLSSWAINYLLRGVDAAEWLTSSSPRGLKVLNIFKSLLSQHSLFLERIGVRRIS